MVTVVILIGRSNSGKTRTLKRFFGIDRRLRPNEYMDRTNGKIVCAVKLNSPQEEEDFCKYEDVVNNINKRLERAKSEVKNRHKMDDFVFIIPFGLYVRRDDGKINEDCILKPIEQLKKEGHAILLIYLNRPSRKPIYDKFMKGLTTHEISSRKDYDNQAKELRKLIFN